MLVRMRCTRAAAVLLTALILAHAGATQHQQARALGEHHRYIVVGAGPAGLQMGHYLHTAGRDYIILERGNGVATFFRKYPRFRQLISINKLYVGTSNADFAYRHDWNSLLAEPSHSSETYGCGRGGCQTVRCGRGVSAMCEAGSVSSSDDSLDHVAPAWRMGTYSSAYYPHADDLVRLYECYAQPLTQKDRCKPPGSHGFPRGDLRIRFGTTVAEIVREAGDGDHRFTVTTTDGLAFTATFVLYAGGMNAILPSGNPVVDQEVEAYSTASNDLLHYENKSLLLIGRGNGGLEFAHNLLPVTAYTHVMGRPTSRIRLSWETHYTGDVRMVHALLLETYLLKSQDAMFEADTRQLRFQKQAGDGTPGSTAWTVTFPSAYDCDNDPSDGMTALCAERWSYDRVVYCPGFWFNSSMFARDSVPVLGANRKHPSITPFFESTSVRDLYFIGALMHGNDVKKSSGGFIHGYRYLVRSLHRHLEEQEARHTPKVLGSGSTARLWPRRMMHSLVQIADVIQLRSNKASGIFQMFGQLMDVFILGSRSLSVGDAGHKAITDVREALKTDNAALARALAGAWFEEVPVLGIPAKVAVWQPEVNALLATPDSELRGPEYVTLSLEFGPGVDENAFRAGLNQQDGDRPSGLGKSTPARASPATAVRTAPRDPFSLDRVNGTLEHPEGSIFLHPVLRYWDHEISTTAPLMVQHLVEDFFANFSDPFKYRLPIARFLLQVAEWRLLGCSAAVKGPSSASTQFANEAARFWALFGQHSRFFSLFQSLSRVSTTMRLASRGAMHAALASVGAAGQASAMLSRDQARELHGLTAWWRGVPYVVGDGWMNLLPMLSASGSHAESLSSVVVFSAPSVTCLGSDGATVVTQAGEELCNDRVETQANALAQAFSKDHFNRMFIGAASSVFRHPLGLSLLAPCARMHLRENEWAVFSADGGCSIVESGRV